MIAQDETKTLEMYIRRITFEPESRPIVGAKKSIGRPAFYVTHLSLRWYEGQEPGPVIAHGVYFNEAEQCMVHVDRSYDLDGKKCPKWIKDAVRG